jgi:hypothetical protein
MGPSDVALRAREDVLHGTGLRLEEQQQPSDGRMVWCLVEGAFIVRQWDARPDDAALLTELSSLRAQRRELIRRVTNGLPLVEAGQDQVEWPEPEQDAYAAVVASWRRKLRRSALRTAARTRAAVRALGRLQRRPVARSLGRRSTSRTTRRSARRVTRAGPSDDSSEPDLATPRLTPTGGAA